MDSLLPGSIGVIVKRAAPGLVVAELRRDSAAYRAGLRTGDVVWSYNGVPVSTTREFNALVTDSRPGTTARLEVVRDGATYRLEIPVREVDTMPRV